MIAVQGKPAPTPKGRIETKNIMAPKQPVLKIHLFNSIDRAINPWQVAINLTAGFIFSANQPRMKVLYHSLQAKSA